MLRTTSNFLGRGVLRAAASRSGGLLKLPQSRSAASGGGGSGGAKFALVTGVTVASLAGGTLGYAGIDPAFRKLVEDAVPGAKDVFHAVLGEPEQQPSPPPVPPSKIKLKDSPPPPLPVTSTPPKAAVAEPLPMPPLEEPPPPSPPPQKKKTKETTTEDVVPKSAETKKTKKKRTEATKKKQQKPELDLLVEDMKVATGMAVLSARESCDAIGKHGRLLVGVLEQNVDGENERAWHDVIEAASEKSEALKAAQDKLQAARDAAEKVSQLAAGTTTDPEAAEAARAAAREVESSAERIRAASEEIGAARKESYLVERYRDLVEEGRQSFRKELTAILPDLDSKQQLTEEEVDVFVTHAYRKVCGLQQQLAKLQLFQAQLDHSAASDQQLRKQVVTESVVVEELEAQRRQLDVEYQQRIHAMREEMEGEVRCQLRRQAAAHSDHVKDSLDVQQSELARAHERRMDEALSEERSAHHRELAKLSGQVEGLKTSLRDGAELQRAVEQAQELWLACCSLRRALQASSATESGGDGLLPLQAEVDVIRTALRNLQPHKEDEDFVRAVLNSLPEEALNRGVHTDQTIRDRFFKVEQMAKRTALVPEEGGSLVLYLLSYLQSLLVLTPSTEVMPDRDVAVDVAALSTFDVVWLARGAVERGDLEQAVRYMTLLKGEPKNVSSGWIAEARLLLETKQVCDVLLSHAAAFGLEALPGKTQKD